jgi:hypothetical protein
MNRIQQIFLVYLLCGIFAITIIPFNAFHQHEIDRHVSAILNQNSNHHCDLDNNFCQLDLTQHCSHDFHLSKTITKCLNCLFHFIKTFDIFKNECNLRIHYLPYFHSKSITNDTFLLSIIHLNKGPPRFS